MLIVPKYQYKPEAQAKVILIPSSIILCESVEVGNPGERSELPSSSGRGLGDGEKERIKSVRLIIGHTEK